ncbi:DUF6678 family protein [Agrobacterium rosae]|uniref:DUF6678 family protein n=1 Tax=Agrobacterium rosae TaxID=1972867 RepID=UPI003BA2E4B2
MLYIGSTESDETSKVRCAIAERGMTSHMNNTKWRTLCLAINEELPFPPPYQVKYVLKERPDPEEIETSPWYHGDWATTPEASLGIFIEWLKVAPRVTTPVGRLLPPHVDDCSDALRNLLRRLRVPFNEEDGFFLIYGHTSSSQTV